MFSRFSATVILMLFLCPLQGKSETTSARTNACDLGPEAQVSDPLLSERARTNFLNYVNKISFETGKPISVPSDFISAAPDLAIWSYKMESSDGSDCKLKYVQRYRLSSFFDSLRRAIFAIRKDGCSFFSVRSVTISVVGRREIVGVGSVFGKQRTCGDWPWGGEWKTDLGGIGGSVTILTGFDTAPNILTDRFSGEIIPRDAIVSNDIELDSILGIDLDTFVGGILKIFIQEPTSLFFLGTTSIPVSAALNEINRAIRGMQGSFSGANFLDSNGGTFSAQEYVEFLQVIKSGIWSYQPTFHILDSQTVLGSTSDGPFIDIVYEASIPSYVADAVWQDALTEIDLFKSFDREARRIVVQKGDTLWNLSAEEYGNPFYYSMLGASNGIEFANSSSLNSGQEITIPPLFDLVFLPGSIFIEPGDTFFGICSRMQPSSVSACLKSAEEINPRYNLSRLFALQPVRIPDFER